MNLGMFPEFEEIDLAFADFLARRAGGELSPERYSAAALAVGAVREGHNCCRLELWAGRTLEEGEHRLTLPPLERYLAELRGWARPEDELSPLVLDAENRLYLRRYFKCERSIARQVRARLTNVLAPPELTAGELAGLLPFFSQKAGRKATDFQQLALYTALSNSFAIISGGPGTGKTTVVAALLALEFKRNPALSAALAAPTGKAQARLAESLATGAKQLNIPEGLREKLAGLPGSTLHKLLGADGRGGFRHDADHPLPYDFVVLDEASMVPLLLMNRLLLALSPNCRLLLLGDRNQLSSVEAGAVLADLCDAAALNALRPEAAEAFFFQTGWNAACVDAKPLSGAVAELSENHRFASAPHIGEFSLAMRDLAPGGGAELARNICAAAESDFVTRQISYSKLEEELTRALTPLRPLAGLGERGTPEAVEEAFQVLNSFRILAAARRGRFGVAAINELARGILGRSAPYAFGVPLMITRNDSRTGLFNGDVGFVHADPANPARSLVSFPGHSLPFSPAELPEHETVYAMTVHKSQGSGFGKVLIILPEEDSPLLTRELIYTAVTRAEREVELWSTEAVLGATLDRKTVRQSGLGSRLLEE